MPQNLVVGLGGAAGFGEASLVRNDDGSTGFIDLTGIFPDGLNFFGSVFNGLYVNNNGSVTFGRSTSTFTPTDISGTTSNPMIAIFWGDVDTRGPIGTISAGGTSTGTDLVYYDFDYTNHIFTVTWDDVGYFSSHDELVNAFQLQIKLVGTDDFNIDFRYETVQWTTGDASLGVNGLGGTVARAGYTSGDGTNFFELPQSGNQNAILGLPTTSNVGQPGLWEFHIRNGVPEYQVSVSDASVEEGNGVSPAFLVFDVTLSAPAATPITVDYATAPGSATVNGDYFSQSGKLTFVAGMTHQQVRIEVLGDTVIEANETFTLTLANAVGATITAATATGVIVNDDGISISDVTVQEGTGSASTSLVFTVSMLTPSTNSVTVNYATADGTAHAGSDYTAASGTLNFAPGETSKTVTVAVAADATAEAEESFAVHLTGATGAQIATADATGTIQNDDGISIANASVVEGTGPGASNVDFKLHLASSIDPAAIATVDYKVVSDGRANSLMFQFSGTLYFNPGETDKTLSIPVVRDSIAEPNYQFSVVLSNPKNATIASGTATGTIVDDDTAGAGVGNASGLYISDVRAREGSTGSAGTDFTVYLGAASADIVTVNYATSAGTATAGTDFTPTSGTLTFAPGVTSQNITVLVLGDTLVESDESFSLTLSNPTKTTIVQGTASGTIVNDDGLSLADITVSEGDSGSTNARIVLTLSTTSSAPVTVNYATADGTATAGSDYAASSGTVTFAPGQTTQFINVPVYGDIAYEPREAFLINLSSAAGSSIVDGHATVYITDNDVLPPATFSVVDAARSEGTGLASNLYDVVVERSGTLDTAVTVDWSTAVSANGVAATATVGNDYRPASGTVAFASGESQKTITIAVAADARPEHDESFFVTLSAPSAAAQIGDGTATVTILNDDSGVIYGGPPARNDFNGDGFGDVLMRNDNGALVTWQSNGSVLSVNLASYNEVHSSWVVESTGDFNGDGKTDLLWRGPGGWMLEWLGNGTGFSVNPSFYNRIDASWHEVGSGDFNGDGLSDVYFHNDNGAVVVWQSNGSLLAPNLSSYKELGTAWQAEAVGDFNGDGRADLLMRDGDGWMQQWLSNGTSFEINTAFYNRADPSWKVAGVGDFNGDGFSDVLFRNDNGAMVDWLSNGSVLTVNLASYAEKSSDWHIESVNDFSGDGRSDILWRNDGGGMIEWLASGDSFVLNPAFYNSAASSWHVM